MSRNPADREDLLREATALVERVELTIPEVADTLLIGFRADGCGSVYVGGDVAFHFNSANLLRRAFYDDKLIKAEHGRLVSLKRQRVLGEVQMLRHSLTPSEVRHLLDQAEAVLNALRQALAAEQFKIVGQVPPEADVISHVRRWLEIVQLAVARSPHAR